MHSHSSVVGAMPFLNDRKENCQGVLLSPPEKIGNFIGETALFKLIFGTQMFLHDHIEFGGRIAPFFHSSFAFFSAGHTLALFLVFPVDQDTKDSGSDHTDDGCSNEDFFQNGKYRRSFLFLRSGFFFWLGQ